MGQHCEQHDSSGWLPAMGISRASDLKAPVTAVWQWRSLGDPNLWNPGCSMPPKHRWVCAQHGTFSFTYSLPFSGKFFCKRWISELLLLTGSVEHLPVATLLPTLMKTLLVWFWINLTCTSLSSNTHLCLGLQNSKWHKLTIKLCLSVSSLGDMKVWHSSDNTAEKSQTHCIAQTCPEGLFQTFVIKSK